MITKLYMFCSFLYIVPIILGIILTLNFRELKKRAFLLGASISVVEVSPFSFDFETNYFATLHFIFLSVYNSIINVFCFHINKSSFLINKKQHTI